MKNMQNHSYTIPPCIPWTVAVFPALSSPSMMRVTFLLKEERQKIKACRGQTVNHTIWGILAGISCHDALVGTRKPINNTIKNLLRGLWVRKRWREYRYNETKRAFKTHFRLFAFFQMEKKTPNTLIKLFSSIKIPVMWIIQHRAQTHHAHAG